MHKKVEHELSSRITNINLGTERDKGLFEEMYEKTGAKHCVEESVRLVGVHEDLSNYSRKQLEEKYHGILATYVDSRTQAIQFMTLFIALDVKLSQVMIVLEEEAGKYPLKLGELRDILYTAGFFSVHKFYVVSEDPKEPAEVPKPKRDRGKLRLIK